MSCSNPRVIINPAYVNLTHKYTFLSGFSFTRYVRTSKFDYSRFSVKANHIDKSNYKNYYAFSSDGDSIPVYLLVPCNHCASCCLQKKHNLKIRMLLEQYGRSTPLYFITLTYNDEHCPIDGVSVRDCQLFFKRFRERLDKCFDYRVPFRYILFSEYGKLRHRPHYHFILFGFDAFKVFGASCAQSLYYFENWLSKEAWQNGFVNVRQCDSGAFDYVSKYVLKKLYTRPDLNPNFCLSSRRNGGIGCHCLSDPAVLRQLYYGDVTSFKIQFLGRQFEFSFPSSILEYMYKDNVQSLRRKYLPHVRNYVRSCSYLRGFLAYCDLSPKFKFEHSSEYRSVSNFLKNLQYSFDFAFKVEDVVDLAPYCPEFGFFSCSFYDPSIFISHDIEHNIELLMQSYLKLCEFNINNYASYLQNQIELCKLRTLKSIKYVNASDSDDSPLQSSRFFRETLDLCRDGQ